MRIAVLGNPDSWYFRDLKRAAGDRCELTCLPFDAIRAGVSNAGPTVGSAGVRLDEFDAVHVRTMAAASLEQVVFRMDALWTLERAGVAVVNPPKTIEAAVDKYLALAKLQAAGLAVPRTIVCQTADDALAAFHELGGDVVVKPIFGAEGRGLVRLTDADLADRAFSLLERLGSVLYVQEFLPHDGADLRALVIGSRIVGMRRSHPTDWRTNISRGAKGEPHELSPEQRDIAARAAEAVGGSLIGVDLLPTRDGRLVVLEVNAVPGWRGLAQATGIDVGRLVIEHFERVAATRRTRADGVRRDG